jgi:hypothetical protein
MVSSIDLLGSRRGKRGFYCLTTQQAENTLMSSNTLYKLAKNPDHIMTYMKRLP